MKILAFTNCTESKAEAIASAKRHVAEDLLIQGRYAKGEKGCSIGCHYGGDNHHAAPQKHGFAIPFVILCDEVFEMQPDIKSAQEFHVWVMEHVAEGADTMRMWWEFFAITVEAIGPEWDELATECRKAPPDMKRIASIARALARASASAIAPDLDRDRALARDRARARALTLARDRARARALTPDLDRDLALARALTSALTLARDRARDRALTRARDRDRARALTRARARVFTLARDRARDFATTVTENFKKAVLIMVSE